MYQKQMVVAACVYWWEGPLLFFFWDEKTNTGYQEIIWHLHLRHIDGEAAFDCYWNCQSCLEISEDWLDFQIMSTDVFAPARFRF